MAVSNFSDQLTIVVFGKLTKWLNSKKDLVRQRREATARKFLDPSRGGRVFFLPLLNRHGDWRFSLT